MLRVQGNQQATERVEIMEETVAVAVAVGPTVEVADGIMVAPTKAMDAMLHLGPQEMVPAFSLGW
jgi:hypothetical protein